MHLPPFKYRWSLFGIFLAGCSLVISLAVLSQQYEGSWGGFLLFLIALPISLTVLFLGNLFGFNLVPFIICAGVIQWYLVGWFIERAVKRSKSRVS